MVKKLINFEPSLARDIARAAKRKHISAAQYVRDACREKLQNDTFTWHDDRAAAQTAGGQEQGK